MPIGTEILAAGEQLLSLKNVTTKMLASNLNEILNRFLPIRFRAIRARARAEDEQCSAEFLTMVCDTNRVDGVPGEHIPSEAMACIVDVAEMIDLETFRTSYARIAQAKAIPKKEPDPENSFKPTNVTLGIILAHNSDVPIEQLAEELDRLNRKHPSKHWPDMVVVLHAGIAQYSLQFPGESEMTSFLPPSHNADRGIPAFIHLTVRSAGRYALNRLLSVLLVHVGTFSTGLNIGYGLKDILLDAPNVGVTICGYQPDVAGLLRPVPEELYVMGKFFAPIPVQIESQNGKNIGQLQFVSWQDGAYIRSIGMPLEPFLAMIGKPIPLTSITRIGSSLSYVLPITNQDFNTLLSRLRWQSNMVIKVPKPTSWTMERVADEGTSAPFVARLMLGVLKLRDESLDEQTSKLFDKDYEAVLSGLESAREAVKAIVTAVTEHREKLRSAVIVQIRNGNLEITESIDRLLSKEIETFLNVGYRVLKDRQQQAMKTLGIDIGFLYQKEASFQRGIAALRIKHAELADYLAATRQSWSEQFITVRNTVHSGWTLSRVRHTRTGDTVTMIEPEIEGRPITEFVKAMLDRLLCFIEETTFYALKTHLPGDISLQEIPNNKRRPELCERFRITLADGIAPLWRLTHHDLRFDEA